MGQFYVQRLAACVALTAALLSLSGFGRRPPVDEDGALTEDAELIVNPSSSYVQIAHENATDSSKEKAFSSMPSVPVMIGMCEKIREHSEALRSQVIVFNNVFLQTLGEARETSSPEGLHMEDLTDEEERQYAQELYDEMLPSIDTVMTGAYASAWTQHIQDLTGLGDIENQPPARLEAYRTAGLGAFVYALMTQKQWLWKWILGVDCDYSELEPKPPLTDATFKIGLRMEAEHCWDVYTAAITQERQRKAQLHHLPEIRQEHEGTRPLKTMLEDWAQQQDEEGHTDNAQKMRTMLASLYPTSGQAQYHGKTISAEARKEIVIDWILELVWKDPLTILEDIENHYKHLSPVESVKRERLLRAKYHQLTSEVFANIAPVTLTESEAHARDVAASKYGILKEKAFRKTRDIAVASHHGAVHDARRHQQAEDWASRLTGQIIYKVKMDWDQTQRDLANGEWHKPIADVTDGQKILRGLRNIGVRDRAVFNYEWPWTKDGSEKVAWNAESVGQMLNEIKTDIAKEKENDRNGPYHELLVLKSPHTIWKVFDEESYSCELEMAHALNILAAFYKAGGYIALTREDGQEWHGGNEPANEEQDVGSAKNDTCVSEQVKSAETWGWKSNSNHFYTKGDSETEVKNLWDILRLAHGAGLLDVDWIPSVIKRYGHYFDMDPDVNFLTKFQALVDPSGRTYTRYSKRFGGFGNRPAMIFRRCGNEDLGQDDSMVREELPDCN